MNIIEAARVVYKYTLHDEEDNVIETQTALSNFSLEIEKGSFVCVLGHNGSGKSSFAKLINGLNLPDEGTILVSGRDTRDEDNILKVRESAGMVFQNPDNQIVANIVEEDVAFGPENMGVPSEEIIERVDSVIEKLGLSAFRYKSPNRLSGGQKQRTAIAGIVAMKPQCIVLDEPTAMLDPSGRKDVLDAVHELNKKDGITIILITHYMEEAIDADRLIVMEKGNIAADASGRPLDGTPRELFTRVDELKKHSLSVPVITELAFRLKNKGLDIPEGILTRKELVEALKALRDKENA
ncbi:MAG: energy-coupling factor transporter ATPase [Eubacteriales bacterium]|nr:energy-coupling factor transporter ATPase [Eubacteriales bacterium]